jgi:flavin reductase (DIM6/NTAB) family NADH-FMN oxidoreductase RutF
MIIDLTEMSAPDAYFTMTQSVIPRPICWALSTNHDSSFNLAPFSYFNAVASDPPLIMFSVGLQPSGGVKDTLTNIQERAEFVVNIASVDQLPELNQTSATLPYGESEVDINQIRLAEVEGFSVPRVADCKLALMCERYHIQTIGNRQQSLIFGEIKSIYIDDQCVEITDKGRLKIYADRIQPLARLGAGEYVSFGDILEAKRPD